MDLLGVGPLELIFILLIVFLILGPNDLAATGKKVGRFLSTVRKSEFWRGVTQVTKEMRDLPTTLMREAELEDAKKEIEKDFKDVRQISREFAQGNLKEIEQDLQTNLNIEDHKIAPPSVEEADQEVPVSEESEAETLEDDSDEGANA